MRITGPAGAVIVAGFGVLAAAGTAFAAPPGIATTVHLPSADGYCAFDVTVTLTSNSQQRGPYVFAGAGSATVTNDATGKSLTYNISGPGKFTSNPDGGFSVDAGGPNLLWTTVANSYPGVPQLAYTTGHVQFTVSKAGVTTAYHLSGRSTDVCAALQ
jgi:hypothetical protein